MKENFKRIVTILLLVVFLLPSTGMMLYVHHCNMSNLTVYNTASPETCCGGGSCNADANNRPSSEVVLKAMQCCTDSSMFIKLGEHLYSHTLKVLIGDFQLLVSGNFFRLIFSDSTDYIVSVFPTSTDPPSGAAYILHSTLRL